MAFTQLITEREDRRKELTPETDENQLSLPRDRNNRILHPPNTRTKKEYAQQFLLLSGDADKALPYVVNAVRGSGVWL